MADIRCPHCGKNNPDFLEVCQFCQSPLSSKSMLHIGDSPTKKNTGELEGVLPEWLKTARQQSRDSAQDDSVPAAAPKVQKEEAPDLLAGLAFQSESSDDEDVPDWLSAINPTTKAKPAAPAAPVEPEPETDFFAQFNKIEPAPQPESPRLDFSRPAIETPPQPTQDSNERDELSEWFSKSSEQTDEPFRFDRDPAPANADWGTGGSTSLPSQEPSAPKEEEDLSWLHNLESAAKGTDELKAPTPDWSMDSAATASSDQDDLSWLNNLGGMPMSQQPPPPQAAPPLQPQEDLSWLNNLGGATASSPSKPEDNDLDWLNKLGAPVPEAPAPQPAKPQEDLSWLNAFNETPAAEPPAQAPAGQEDLSWLNAFKTQDEIPSAPAQPAAQEDLSWLNTLGSASESPAAGQSQQPQEDLGWLNALGSQEAAQPAPAPSASQEDLSWLNSFGATPAAQSPAQPEASQDDLSWLNSLGSAAETSQPALTPEPSQQPSAQQDDLSWLNNLQGQGETLSSSPFAEAEPRENDDTAETARVSPFVPRKTAPLDSESDASIPDWLKSATEGPSMPMGTSALDQFREDYKIPSQPEEPFSWKSFTQDAKLEDEQPPLSQPAPAFFDPGTSSPVPQSSTPSADDVNSLFSIEMPDWLSAEPVKEEPAQQNVGIHAESGDALAPVDLPSWVQAMRPMEAVISDASPSIDNQPTEREGPLAGFKGVIPAVPVGSARRPKPISLKLQVSDEQQTSASILEQLLTRETSPRPLVSTPVVASQRTLRLALATLFMIVLSVTLGVRMQLFLPSAILPADSQNAKSVIEQIPNGSNVLVVVDYEPALAGEMEAVSGPILDQLALLHRPVITFVSTSPNGSGLVERLMSNTKVSKPVESTDDTNKGLGYVTGQDYFNLGYLPGAEAGVLAFIQSPTQALPVATVGSFSDYAAVIVLTDNADSARIWIEQLENLPQSQPLLVASSAQAGPMLQPYASSGQIDGMVTGLADATRVEFVNGSRPGIARSYFDAFSVGLLMAVVLIVLGSLWSIFAGIRARRAEAAFEE